MTKLTKQKERVVAKLAAEGRLVVWVEATGTLHEVSHASRNGPAIQLNCLQSIDEKAARLITLLWCNMDAIPEGEIRRLVADLYQSQQPVYEGGES